MGEPYEHLVRVIKINWNKLIKKKIKKNSKATNPLGQPYEHLVRVINLSFCLLAQGGQAQNVGNRTAQDVVVSLCELRR